MTAATITPPPFAAVTVFLGRCKGCKAVTRTAAPLLDVKKYSRGYGRYSYAHYWLVAGKRVEADGAGYLPYTCACGRAGTLHAVRGTVTACPCDSRCTGATGHNCECSCGGANHGIAHAK